MKNVSRLSVAILALWACACKPAEELKPEIFVPEPQFTICGTEARDVYEIPADSTMSFMAEIKNTSVYDCAWYLDDEKIANTTSFVYTFADPGSFAVRFNASNEKGEKERTFTVNVAGAPLDVAFSILDEKILTTINEHLKIAATVLAGDKQTQHSWKVNGEEVSTVAEADLCFDAPGIYTVSYFGINRDKMTASRQWTVEVHDLPLAVSYTPASTEIAVVAGDELTFKAEVSSGIFGLAHKWTVNDAPLGTDAVFTYTFESAGNFTVKHEAQNAEGEEASRSWTVTVAEKPVDPVSPEEEGVLIFDDFEKTATGVSSYYIGNAVSGVSVLQVVENPFKTETNPSSHVLVDKGSMMTGTSSGYFKFKVNTFPDLSAFPSADRAKYDRIRIKVYVGDSGFTPLLQEDAKSTRSTPCKINGVEFNTASPSMDAWNAAIKTNDWNVFVYDLTGPKYSTEVNDLSGTEQLQFRVFVDFNNNGKAGKDIYFDDIALIEKGAPDTPQEKGLMFDNFESKTVGVDPFYKGNSVAGVSILQVVENPYKTSTNNSSKCLVDLGSLMANTSSGYFTIKIGTYPDGTAFSSEERAGYTRMRVKVYLGDSGFTPLLREDKKNTKSTPCEINGIPFDTANPTMTAWNAAIRTNDWNVFIYDLTGPKYASDINNLAQTDQFQFRVFVDFGDNGKAGKDIYFDDIEFLK